MAKTPSTNEFLQVSKIAGAGIIFIGLVGFIIGAIMVFLTSAGGA